MNIDRADVVRGDWEILNGGTGSFGIKVMTPDMEQVIQRTDQKGSFSFTSKAEGEFVICYIGSGFWSTPPAMGYSASGKRMLSLGITVGKKEILDAAKGVQAHNSEGTISKQKFSNLELRAIRVETLARNIYNSIVEYKERELEYALTSSSTSWRVVYLSLFTMFSVVFLSLAQMFYLRYFFHSKKLL